ncbi:phosphopantetheine-binding protein [Actinacidiphila glaucinigra]
MLQELYLGRVRWDLLLPFPEQDPGDRRAGDDAVGRVRDLLRDWIDPAVVDAEGRLPGGFLDALQKAGLLRLMIDPSLGGLGLSWFNACRVIEEAAGWCMPVAFTLAIHNGFGSGSYLTALPPGPLHDLIRERVSEGIVSAAADAEPTGTANQRRTTVATPVEDGAAYLVSGEKCFIGNGPVADFLDVSATVVADDGTESVRLFFLDTCSPGFEVVSTHEFMGLRGAAIGMLRLDRVRVPAEQMLPELSDGWRMRPGWPEADPGRSGPRHAVAPDGAELTDLGQLALLARHIVIAPASLAVARLGLLWAKDFVNRRTIDGKRLAEYEEIRRQVAEQAAEVFTVESALEWGVLGSDSADTRRDLTAVKNLTSAAGWRAIDRTMALLGAEGYETAHSKAARGVPPLPVERCFRDARALRVAGGVDFMLDMWSAKANLAAHYRPGGPCEAPPVQVDEHRLPERSRQHLRSVNREAERFADLCREWTGRLPSEELFARQRTVKLLGQLATELLGMAVVVARSAGLAERGDRTALDLADIACAAAGARLSGLWSQLAAEGDRTGSDPSAVGAALLGDTDPDTPAGDVPQGHAGNGVCEAAPRRETEAVVAAIWCELFGREEIGLHDDFYELGGHSLLAIRMVARLRDALGVRVPVRCVLENPTVTALVDALGSDGPT